MYYAFTLALLSGSEGNKAMLWLDYFKSSSSPFRVYYTLLYELTLLHIIGRIEVNIGMAHCNGIVGKDMRKRMFRVQERHLLD